MLHERAVIMRMHPRHEHGVPRRLHVSLTAFFARARMGYRGTIFAESLLPGMCPAQQERPMSITSIGGAGSGISQIMASLLSRVQQSESAASPTAPTVSDVSTDTSNAATGASEPTLSDQVISALVAMQMQNGDAASSSSSSSTSSSQSDPVSQAFAGLDTNGDGSISQSELESAIENAGGTAGEADSVYAALGGTSDTGISQDSFSQAAQAGAPGGPPPGGPGGPGGAHGHHHHHHGGSAPSASDEAGQVLSSLQTNADGSVSDDTLASALGGSTDGSTSSSGASSAVSSIDSNGDGSVSQTELANYLQSLQQQSQGDNTTLASFLQLASQSYNTALSGYGAAAGTQLSTAA
jgi:Ca2+-binding EF-hand superfamily protein